MRFTSRFFDENLALLSVFSKSVIDILVDFGKKYRSTLQSDIDYLRRL